MTPAQIRSWLALEGWEMVAYNGNHTVIRIDKAPELVLIASASIWDKEFWKWKTPVYYEFSSTESFTNDPWNPRLAVSILDDTLIEMYNVLVTRGES
jgi:hypothetical protein